MLLQLRNKSAPKFSTLSLTSIIKQPLIFTQSDVKLSKLVNIIFNNLVYFFVKFIV